MGLEGRSPIAIATCLSYQSNNFGEMGQEGQLRSTLAQPKLALRDEQNSKLFAVVAD
jgi:hypothetical protein